MTEPETRLPKWLTIDLTIIGLSTIIIAWLRVPTSDPPMKSSQARHLFGFRYFQRRRFFFAVRPAPILPSRLALAATRLRY